jgi:hypothetical protein
MRSLPLVVALFTAAAATGAAARDLPRTSAESNASYSCRLQLTPASRSCLATCSSTFKQPAQEDERWSCVQACTAEHVRAVRECREDATATAKALAPVREADDDQPIAFDAGKLTE